METDERELKQSFLRKEIIEENLDAELFTEFCESKKGSEIDLWTLEELKQVVKEFKERFKTQEKEPNLEVLECKKLEETELSSSVEKIVISEPEKVQGRIFSSDYMAYYVLTLPLGWSVLRRYSDFLWLRDALQKFYPGHYVPTLPYDKDSPNMGPNKLCRIKKHLSLFMDYIVNSSYLSKSQVLLEFLKEETEKNFQVTKKKYSKSKKLITVHDFYSDDGKITCDFDIDSQVVDQVLSYFNEQGEVLKLMSLEAKKIKSLTIQISNSLYNFMELAKNLQNISVNLSDLKKKNDDFLNNLNQSLQSYEKYYMESSTYLNEHLEGVMNFLVAQMAPLKSLIKERQSLYQDLNKFEAKKEKSLIVGKALTQKFSDKLSRARLKFGYFNNQAKCETQQTAMHWMETLKQEYFLFAKKLMESNQKMQEFLKLFLQAGNNE